MRATDLTRLGAVLLLVLWGAAPAAGQDRGASDDRTVLEGMLPDSIVVTASRYPEDVRETGRRVAVWTARDIDRLPVTSFDDLLRTVAGVDAQSRGGFGIQSDLSIRGSGFNGVLLLLDGAPVNDPMTGHFLADLPVPLSEIARVEVLRGPASAVYGPDALGGVVQIFTYAGLRDEPRPAGRSSGAFVSGWTSGATDVRASVRAGEHRLYEVDGSASGEVGAVFVSGASAWQGTRGERITGDIRTDFRRRVHTAAAVARAGASTFYARAGWDDREFGAWHFYTPFPSDSAREATATYWGQVRMRAPAGDVHLSLKQHGDRYVYNPSTPANVHTSRMANLTATTSRDVTPSLGLSAGFDAGLRGIDSNNLGRHQDFSGGAHAAARWRRGSLAVRGGGRADYDPGYGFELTPQLYGTYSVGWMDLRAGAARAVRAPNYIERYFNTTLASPRGRSLGNPDLQPERAVSLEAGVSVRPSSSLALHITGFRRVTRNLIDYAKLAEADTVFLARNLHRVRANGLDSELEIRRPVGGGLLHLAASHTFLAADLGEIPTGVEYKYALTHARHLGQVSMSLSRDRFEVGLRGLYKDPIDGPSYRVVHGRAAFAEPLGSSRIVVSLELRNVFDVYYSDLFDAPLPGRWWIFGVELTSF